MEKNNKEMGAHAKEHVVVLDYYYGKVYVYPHPGDVDIENWLANEKLHNLGYCEWMVTKEPLVVY